MNINIEELYRQRDELNEQIEALELGVKVSKGDTVFVKGIIEETDLIDKTIKVFFDGENAADYCWVSPEIITKVEEE